jgi:hypothetical protein
MAVGILLTASGAKAGGCGVTSSKAAAATPAPFVSLHVSNLQLGNDFLDHTIVGMWHVIYTANTDSNFPPGSPTPPTPFQFNESIKTWHADGTEWENAFLPPAGGNICYGVWKAVSFHTVKLHHLGLMFAADGSLSATFTDDEVNTLSSDGQSYTGTFVFKLWPPSFAAIGVGTPISEVTGTTAATRITVD